MHPIIREALPEDALSVSELIRTTLYTSNLTDYGEENIARVAQNLNEAVMLDLIRDRHTLVAETDGRICGTAAHHEGSIRTVFVEPDHQRLGIGGKLTDRIIARSIELGESHLTVQSSVFAEPFYKSIDFRALEDLWHGDERTILMRLDHPAP